MAVGHDKLGEGIVDLFELEVAALGDLHGALEDGGRVLEDGGHLVGALDEELVAVEAEAFFVVDFCAGLHAEHHVVGF